jgi:23S rRNA (cytosine1962-C5)-methyltransferase
MGPGLPGKAKSPKVILKTGRDRSVRRRHPWIFSGAVAQVEDGVFDGSLVDVFSADDAWLARGYYNRRSQIIVRLLTWNREEPIDEQFWRDRLIRARIGRTASRSDSQTTAYRLVNAESDGLPGLIVDRYADWFVVQALTLGIEKHKSELARLLMDVSEGVRGVYERSDVDVRQKEGLKHATGPLWGPEPPELVEVLENGYRFLVDLRNGHKTGFYLDQRESRARISEFCDGAEMLNAFAYTGAFGIYGLGGGAASVVNVDTSKEVLDLAWRHVVLKGYEGADV